MKVEALHQKAVSLAQTYRSSEAELLSVLVEMVKAKAFLPLGYTGIWSYLVDALKLSDAQAYYFKRVAEKSIEVPALKTAVQTGKISLSKARRIESVVTKANAKSWIEKAQELPQRELEREVATVNPKSTIREKIKPLSDTRSELRLGISKDFEKKLERLKALTGKKAEEALECALDELLHRIDPEKKAERAKKKEPKLALKSLSSGNRTPIPAQVKHEVVKRSGYRCTKCETSYYLHYHHKTPVAQGGKNTAENLELLCSAHHRMHHALTGLPSRSRTPHEDPRPVASLTPPPKHHRRPPGQPQPG